MNTQVMKISLDGGVTFQDIKNDVRIVYQNVDVPGEEEKGELHITLSKEGVTSDVWVSRDEPLDHNIGTKCDSLDNIIGDMVEENL